MRFLLVAKPRHLDRNDRQYVMSDKAFMIFNRPPLPCGQVGFDSGSGAGAETVFVGQGEDDLSMVSDTVFYSNPAMPPAPEKAMTHDE